MPAVRASPEKRTRRIGDGQEHGMDPAWDGAEAEMLYQALEQEVAPEFYARNDHGIPLAWTARMRESMARLTPQFSANRAVREYTEHRYLPAAGHYRSRTAQKGLLGRQLVESQRRLEKQWPALHFGDFRVENRNGQNVFDAQVFLGDLQPQAVRVELYANGVREKAPVRLEMKLASNLLGMPGGCIYRAAVSADRPASDYTVRIVPHRDGVAVPLEEARILWLR